MREFRVKKDPTQVKSRLTNLYIDIENNKIYEWLCTYAYRQDVSFSAVVRTLLKPLKEALEQAEQAGLPLNKVAIDVTCREVADEDGE
jgi:hypothetical protein